MTTDNNNPAGHTPRPWYKAERARGLIDIRSSKSAHLVAQVATEETNRCERNADLIAAAPELLAACKEFVRKCDCGEASSRRSYAQMKAAIAKAEGREA